MKKALLIILFTIIILYANAQNTYVPDDNFEQALIDLGYDDVLDDYVLTANINGIISLNVGSQNISDLTGIEDFTAIEEFFCGYNQLTNLNFSQNINLRVLFCDNNQISDMDITQNINLEIISCWNSEIAYLDVTQNTALRILSCHGNQLVNIDITHNNNLTDLYCENNFLSNLNLTQNSSFKGLVCFNNQLTNLDIRNGNNDTITYFDATDNPNLKCIYVDDKNASYLSGWEIDPASTFVETEAECDALDIENSMKETCNIIYPNPSEGVIYIDFAAENYIKRLIISDITGKQILVRINIQQNTSMLHTLDLSEFKEGIYIIDIQTEKEVFTSKIIKI